jgi:hypothetical protein
MSMTKQKAAIVLLLAYGLVLAQSCRKKGSSGPSSESGSEINEVDSSAAYSSLMMQRVNLSGPVLAATEDSGSAETASRAKSALASIEESASVLTFVQYGPMLEGLIQDGSLTKASNSQVADVLENIAAVMTNMASNEPGSELNAALEKSGASGKIKDLFDEFGSLAAESVNGNATVGASSSNQDLESKIAQVVADAAKDAKQTVVDVAKGGAGDGSDAAKPTVDNPVTTALTLAAADGDLDPDSDKNEDNGEETAESDLDAVDDSAFAGSNTDVNQNQSTTTEQEQLASTSNQSVKGAANTGISGNSSGTTVKTNDNAKGVNNAAIVANALGLVQTVANGGQGAPSDEAKNTTNQAAQAVVAAGPSGRGPVAIMMRNLATYVDEKGSSDSKVQKQELKSAVAKGRKAARALRNLRKQVIDKIADPEERKVALRAVTMLAQELKKVDSPDEASKVEAILEKIRIEIKEGNGSLQSVVGSIATGRNAVSAAAAASNTSATSASGSGTESGGNSVSGALVGTFVGPCQPAMTGWAMQSSYVFTATAMERHSDFYNNTDCSGTPKFRDTTSSNIVQGTPNSSGARNLDVTGANKFFTPKDATLASDMSTEGVCGFNNWVANEQKDVSRRAADGNQCSGGNCNCTINAVPNFSISTNISGTQYTTVTFANGKLNFGNSQTSSGTTAENRTTGTSCPSYVPSGLATIPSNQCTPTGGSSGGGGGGGGGSSNSSEAASSWDNGHALTSTYRILNLMSHSNMVYALGQVTNGSKVTLTKFDPSNQTSTLAQDLSPSDANFQSSIGAMQPVTVNGVDHVLYYAHAPVTGGGYRYDYFMQNAAGTASSDGMLRNASNEGPAILYHISPNPMVKIAGKYYFSGMTKWEGTGTVNLASFATNNYPQYPHIMVWDPSASGCDNAANGAAVFNGLASSGCIKHAAPRLASNSMNLLQLDSNTAIFGFSTTNSPAILSTNGAMVALLKEETKSTKIKRLLHFSGSDNLADYHSESMKAVQIGTKTYFVTGLDIWSGGQGKSTFWVHDPAETSGCTGTGKYPAYGWANVTYHNSSGDTTGLTDAAVAANAATNGCTTRLFQLDEASGYRVTGSSKLAAAANGKILFSARRWASVQNDQGNNDASIIYSYDPTQAISGTNPRLEHDAKAATYNSSDYASEHGAMGTPVMVGNVAYVTALNGSGVRTLYEINLAGVLGAQTVPTNTDAVNHTRLISDGNYLYFAASRLSQQSSSDSQLKRKTYLFRYDLP